MIEEEVKHINDRVAKYQIPTTRSKEEAWALMQERMANRMPEKGRSISMGWISGIAVAAAVVVVFICFKVFMNGTNFSEPITTGLAQMDTILLPDQSSVVLNSNSTIKYSYGKKRIVELQGEAMFDVEKGDPFIVEYEAGKILVQGTKFMVSAYSEDFTEVCCVEGRVKVGLDDDVVYLEKGEGAKVYKGTVSGPYKVDDDAVMQRMEGVYYWNEIALNELLDMISYRFGYGLKINGSIENRSFSGYIDLVNLEDAIDLISVSMQLEIGINQENKIIEVDAH